jgi:hypothetical protein
MEMTLEDIDRDNAALAAEVSAQLELLASATMADMAGLAHVMRIAVADGGSNDLRLNLGVAAIERLFGKEKASKRAKHQVPARLLRLVRQRQVSAPAIRPRMSTYGRKGFAR